MTQDTRRHETAAIAKAWIAAANEQDADRLAALSSPDIQVVGPLGTVRGVLSFATGSGVQG